MRVDFPAPLAPISPVTPGAKLTVSPPSAVTSPGYTLVSAVASMTAGAAEPAAAAAVGGVPDPVGGVMQQRVPDPCGCARRPAC